MWAPSPEPFVLVTNRRTLTLSPLSDRRLAVTVGHYATPAGTDIDQGGIAPDFRSSPSAEALAARLSTCRING